MKALIVLINRDISFFFIKKGSFFNILSMFMMLTFLLSNLLPTQDIMISSGLLLIVHIITTTTFSHYIFQDDYQDSSLDQLRSSGHSTALIVVAKLFSYWALNAVVLILGIGIYLITYAIPIREFIAPTSIIIITSIISTSILTLVSILTLSGDRSGLLNLIIGTPLLISFFLYSLFLINSKIEITNLVSLIIQLKILIGFCLIILPISVFACSHSLSEIQCKS